MTLTNAETAEAVRDSLLDQSPAPIPRGTMPDALEIRPLPPLTAEISVALVSFLLDHGTAGLRWCAQIWIAQHWQGGVDCGPNQFTGNHGTREDAEAEVLRKWAAS